MATVGQVKTHEPVMRPHDGLVSLEVGGAAAQALDVDAPFLSVKSEGLEGTRLAEQLDRVDVLIAAVVSCTGVALGVFVGHGRTKRVKDGAGCDILGSNEQDGLALALNLLLLLVVRDYLKLEVSKHTMIWATSWSVSTKDFSMSWVKLVSFFTTFQNNTYVLVRLG